MWRALAIAVVVANVLFFGYSRGWFDGVFGLDSSGGREPERLARQLRPESLRVVPGAASAGSASATTANTDSAATACLETPAIAEAEAPAAEAALKAALPLGRWIEIRTSDGASTTRRFRVELADIALTSKLAALKLDGAGRIGFAPCAARP